ncbi:MAG: hypothetical protein ABSG68_10165 [Thermoguttaceae bacterium]|jgi:hypothetical protein
MNRTVIAVIIGISCALFCGQDVLGRGFGGAYDEDRDNRGPARVRVPPPRAEAYPVRAEAYPPVYREAHAVREEPRVVHEEARRVYLAPAAAREEHIVRGEAYRHEHVALPTDVGFGHVVAPTYVVRPSPHHVEPLPHGVAVSRGVAVREAFNHRDVFTRDWYAAHPVAWHPGRWEARREWSYATWPAMAGWFAWGPTVAPVYYDYGNTVVYQGDQVYSNGQPMCMADQYYQQAYMLTQSAAAFDPNTGNWMPLGVFSCVQGNQVDTSKMFQLAVSQSGAVAGNYSDVVAGITQPIHGAVDRTTQRLAFTVGDNRTTVYDTGMYNLTLEQSPLLVHVGPGLTQQWMLVRLPPQQ